MNCDHNFRPLVEDKGWMRRLTMDPLYPFICLRCGIVRWHTLSAAHALDLVVLSNAGNES